MKLRLPRLEFSKKKFVPGNLRFRTTRPFWFSQKGRVGVKLATPISLQKGCACSAPRGCAQYQSGTGRGLRRRLFMIIAGEASGDVHGGLLARELRQLSPEIELSGLGGPEMAAAGVRLYHSLVEVAVIGFVEVLKNLPRFRRVFYSLTEKLETEKPELVILIDYPGFNLRFARQAKKRGIPVVYYISPQVWAWGKRRLHLIKKYVDRMICIFQFEEKLFREQEIPVTFVGHPLLDYFSLRPPKDPEQIYAEFGLDKAQPVIALLPGSRENEIKRHLPTMLAAASLIKRELPPAQFLILKPGSVSKETYAEDMEKSSLPAAIVENRIHDGLTAADLALVCSGTATLETALLETPMIIIYQVSFLTWLAIKPLIKIPHLGLVNIVAGRRIVPELLQYEARPGRIAREALKILRDAQESERIKGELARVKEKLGTPGASRRAAEIVLNF